jgi:pimeloyl-ACP methyl ester carboxylesterase
VVYDVARSVARAPLVWTNQVVNDLATMPVLEKWTTTPDPQEAARQLVCDYAFIDTETCKGNDPSRALRFKKAPMCNPFKRTSEETDGHIPDDPRPVLSPDTFPISVGEDRRTCSEMVSSFLSYAVTLPSRLLLEAPLDAFGTAAWDVMLRGTQMLFDRDDEFQHRAEDFADPAAHPDVRALAGISSRGGVSMFLPRLEDEIRRQGGAWEITIVAHSMGTIIANQMLRQAVARPYQMQIRDIVYMAAAASVQDVLTSVMPYLRKRHRPSFYNLMLHPVADERERYATVLDPTPRGSLLVMIDNFLSKPLTVPDRTAGRFDNFMRSVHLVPQDVRPRVHIKSFGVGHAAEATSPVKHGDFTSRFKFWRPECWKPEAVGKRDPVPPPCVYPPE